jgi:rubredoxin
VEGVDLLDEARRIDAKDVDYIEFARTGSAAAGEYRCSGCGYGVTVQAALPHCLMCAGTTWEPAALSPFSPDGRLL